MVVVIAEVWKKNHGKSQGKIARQLTIPIIE